jgi:hypothetical protein
VRDHVQTTLYCQHNTAIVVPADIPFLGISDALEKLLAPVEGSHIECGVTLVSLQPTLDECMAAIRDQGEVKSSDVTRKPPICLSRLARGGKTTALSELRTRLANEGFLPIFISFNGNFRKFRHETDSEAILRLIAVQLVREDYNNQHIRVEASELKEYLTALQLESGRRVVTLIDELNSLAFPPDEDAAFLLRDLFLDPRGRFLVFSTHRPMYLDARAYIGGETAPASGRGVVFVEMPECTDLPTLQSIALCCRNITNTEMIMYGGIPALLYSFKSSAFSRTTLAAKFDIMSVSQRWHEIIGTSSREYLASFSMTVLDGKAQSFVRLFDMLSTVTTEGTCYPLVYVARILQFLNTYADFDIVNCIVELVQHDLAVHAQSTNSGKEWEILVQIAILLHFLRALLGSTRLSLFGTKYGNIGYADMVRIPSDCETLEQARDFIRQTMSSKPHHSVTLFLPISATFPMFDCFVGLKMAEGLAEIVLGCQMKASRGYPAASSVVPDWVTQAVLIRGEALATSTNTREKWKFLVSAEVASLLGFSLRPFMSMKVPSPRTLATAAMTV